MSRNLLKSLFTNVYNFLNISDTRTFLKKGLSKENAQKCVKMAQLFMCIGTASHCLYAISTNKTEDLVITDKYQMVRNGYTEFMIVDGVN